MPQDAAQDKPACEINRLLRHTHALPHPDGLMQDAALLEEACFSVRRRALLAGAALVSRIAPPGHRRRIGVTKRHTTVTAPGHRSSGTSALP